MYGLYGNLANYVSRKVKVDSLTFINFQENYQTAEIYFCSYHVTPLSKTVYKVLLTFILSLQKTKHRW